MKVPVPQDEWAVTENTHPPLVSQELFDRAARNLGRGSKDYRAYDHVRKSIFSGIAVCAKCGHALCSGGTVYKGEREKYWYLSCTHQRQDIANSCEGVRIRYADLVELVTQDLNALLSLTDEQMDSIVQSVLQRGGSEEAAVARKRRSEQIAARLSVIDRIIVKLYSDNAEGALDDDRLRRMVDEYQAESRSLRAEQADLTVTDPVKSEADNYARLFDLVRQNTRIEKLDRNIMLTFIQRIEVGPKQFPPGLQKATHRNTPFSQKVRIIYKFVGDIDLQDVLTPPEGGKTRSA